MGLKKKKKEKEKTRAGEGEKASVNRGMNGELARSEKEKLEKERTTNSERTSGQTGASPVESQVPLR